MVILAVIVILILMFFMMRRHVGAPILAVVAGGFANGVVNESVTDFLVRVLDGVPGLLVSSIICLLFVVIFPLTMYFRGASGLHGAIRIVQAVVLAVVIVTMAAVPIENTFVLDGLSLSVLDAVRSFSQLIIVVGLGVAYWDIIKFRSAD
jgi:hypothetical protein